MVELGRGAPHIMVLSRALFVFPLMEVRSRVLCVAACYLSRARHDSSASRLTCAASLLIYCIAIVSRSLATPGLQYHRRISRRYVSLSLLVSIPTSSGRLFLLSSSPPLALATASLFSLLRHFSFLFLLYLSKPSPFLNSLFHPLFFYLEISSRLPPRDSLLSLLPFALYQCAPSPVPGAAHPHALSSSFTEASSHQAPFCGQPVMCYRDQGLARAAQRD